MLDITQNLKTLHTQYGQYLRATLIRSLRADPLLVEAEEVLHSIVGADTSQMFGGQIRQMLREGPLPADVDDLTYMSDEREVLERFRAAMGSALRNGSSLSDAEREILSSLGFEKLGEFRSKMQSHLGVRAEIPEEDLAIYIPAGEGRGQAFREAIEEQLQAFEFLPKAPEPTVKESKPAPDISREHQALPEDEFGSLGEDALPLWEPHVIQQPEVREQVEIPKRSELISSTERKEMLIESLTVETPAIGEVAPGVMFDFLSLNPVPRLTAALEAAGFDEVGFGFILRYGRYAPEGRKSEFIVGGLGLADLSNRLSSWLRAQGPMEAQIQVVDEGSGELAIYLLAQEGA